MPRPVLPRAVARRRRPLPGAVRAFVILPFLLGAGAALAQGAPRSIGECERLKNDLAYNQCLAMFGPEARMITGGDGAAGRGPAAPQASAAAMAAIPYAEGAPVAADESPAQTSGEGSGRRSYRRGGRQRASFEVGGGSLRRSWSRWRRRR